MNDNTEFSLSTKTKTQFDGSKSSVHAQTNLQFQLTEL